MRVLFLVLTLMPAFAPVAQTTSIPDPVFEQYLMDAGMVTGTLDGVVDTDEIADITELYLQNQNISSLVGIEDFAALETLRCDWNQLTSLDLSQNSALLWLYCSFNQLASLDVSGCPNLYFLNVDANELTALDLTQNPNLADLVVSQNNLTSLDLSQNPGIVNLFCYENALSSLTVSNLTHLEKLWVSDNNLTDLDITVNTELTRLSVDGNQLTSLDISNHPGIETFHCQNNPLQCLNVRNGNNSNFTVFVATNTPALTCIEVDDTVWANANWSGFVDSGTSFSILCSNTCSSNQLGFNAEPTAALRIYPNPTSQGFLTIQTNQTDLHYQCFDMNGRLLQQGAVGNNTIQLKDMEPGSYYLVLVDAAGNRIGTERFAVSE